MPQDLEPFLDALSISSPIPQSFESPVKYKTPKAPQSTPSQDQLSKESEQETLSHSSASAGSSNTLQVPSHKKYDAARKVLFFQAQEEAEDTESLEESIKEIPLLQQAFDSRTLRYLVAAQRIDHIIKDATQKSDLKIKELADQLSALTALAPDNIAHYPQNITAMEEPLDNLLDELSRVEGSTTGNVSSQNEFYFDCNDDLKQMVVLFLRAFYEEDDNVVAIAQNRQEKLDNTGSDSPSCLSFFMLEYENGSEIEKICFVAVSSISSTSKGMALWNRLDEFIQRYNQAHATRFFLADGAAKEVHELILEVSHGDNLGNTRNVLNTLRDVKSKFECLIERLGRMDTEDNANIPTNSLQYAKRLERINKQIDYLKNSNERLKQNTPDVNTDDYMKTCAEKPLFISLLKFITQKRTSGYNGKMAVTGAINIAFDNQLRARQQINLEKNTDVLLVDDNRGLKTIPCCPACIRNKSSVMAALFTVMEDPFKFLNTPPSTPRKSSDAASSSTFSPLRPF